MGLGRLSMVPAATSTKCASSRLRLCCVAVWLCGCVLRGCVAVWLCGCVAVGIPIWRWPVTGSCLVSAALQYVQANALAFGADSKRVTLFGQGSGALSVAALMSTTASKQLFSVRQPGCFDIVVCGQRE